MGRFDRKRKGSGGGKSKMYDAVCNECGKDCKVPFQPTGSKPVYCSSCFEKRDDRSDRGGRDRSGRGRYEKKRMYTAICDSCGARCEVPFKPTSGKPIYCSKCFEDIENGGKPTRRIDNSEVIKSLDMLNDKVNQILRILISNESDAKNTYSLKQPIEGKKRKKSGAKGVAKVKETKKKAAKKGKKK